MPYNGTGEVITKLLEYFFVAAIISAILLIVIYVFQGIALYSLSKRRRLGTSAFAWIPILSSFKLGQIADHAVLIGSRRITHYKWLLPVFLFAGSLCTFISSRYTFSATVSTYSQFGAAYNNGLLLTSAIFSIIGMGLTITALVFYHISLYYVYRSCSRYYVVFLVLGIIFSILPAIFLFAVRKKVNPEYFYMT